MGDMWVVLGGVWVVYGWCDVVVGGVWVKPIPCSDTRLSSFWVWGISLRV
jgi:hypothetical protein